MFQTLCNFRIVAEFKKLTAWRAQNIVQKLMGSQVMLSNTSSNVRFFRIIIPISAFLSGDFDSWNLRFCRQHSFHMSCHYWSRKLPSLSSVYSKQKHTVLQNTFCMQEKTGWLAFATVNVKALNYLWVIVSSKTYLFIWKCSRFSL